MVVCVVFLIREELYKFLKTVEGDGVSMTGDSVERVGRRGRLTLDLSYRRWYLQ